MGRDLRSKLRRQAERSGEALARPIPSGPGLRDYLRRRSQKATTPREPVELPAGEELENAQGRCWLRRLRYPAESEHGALPLSVTDGIDWQRIAELGKDESFAVATLPECCFLDTETTGLSGGAGTTVFLTGMGWFEAGEFVLEQVYLRSFDEEPAALFHVAERLREHPLQVSFVGKSFDRHRLATRMTLHRIESNVLAPRHIDLLYLARRQWKDQLPDTRLRTLEEHRLGLHRADDLPGSEAPQAWIDWLRDKSGPVDRVMEHNRLDVLSLVTLLGRLGGGASSSCPGPTP